MSEQISGTHGPTEDDAIKRQDRSELQAHGDEWPEPELPGGDEPERPGPRRAGSPEHRQGRTGRPSSCAATWPVTWTVPRSRRPGRICSRPSRAQAGQRLLDVASSLPDGATFASLGELLRALWLAMEERPA